MQFKSVISIFKTSFHHWQSHRATRMGAALSYYTIFSIVPLLMLVLIVVGPILGDAYIQKAIVLQVHTLINSKSADFIQTILVGLSDIKFNPITIVVGIITLIIGTLGVFYELKNSLDDLWDTKQPEKEINSWKYFFSSRVLSLSMIPILGFLLLISIVFSALISYISGYSSLFAKMTSIFQTVSYTHLTLPTIYSV